MLAYVLIGIHWHYSQTDYWILFCMKCVCVCVCVCDSLQKQYNPNHFILLYRKREGESLAQCVPFKCWLEFCLQCFLIKCYIIKQQLCTEEREKSVPIDLVCMYMEYSINTNCDLWWCCPTTVNHHRNTNSGASIFLCFHLVPGQICL